jgi:DNA modification methylase
VEAIQRARGVGMTVQLILGDSAQVLKTLPAASIDLTVTSPPYDNLRTYKGTFKFDFETIAQELYRVTKPGGVVVWVVGDATINGSETGTSFRQALYFKEIGFNLHDTMIYQTSKPPQNGNRYEQEFEFMFVFSVGSLKKFNPIYIKESDWQKERRKTKHIKTYHRDINGIAKHKKAPTNTGYRVSGNVWHIKSGYSNTTKDDYAFEHPAIFPEALARDHILSWSNPGDMVLDPFLGSGTTLKMAVLYDRNGIGIELEPEYMAIAEKRIHDAEQQMRLF